MNIRETLAALLGLKKVPEGEGFEGFTDEQLAEAASLANASFAAAKEAKDAAAGLAAVETIEAIEKGQADRAAANKEVEDEFAALEARITVQDDGADDGNDDAKDDDKDGQDDDAKDDATDDKGGNETNTSTPAAVSTDAPANVPVAAPAVDTEAIAAAVATAIAAELKPVIQAAAVPVKPVVPKPTAVITVNEPAKPVFTLLASGDIMTSGKEMSEGELIASYVEKADILSKSRNEGKIPVAKVKVDWEPERFLSVDDSHSTNTAKIMKMVAAVQAESRKNLDAILATSSPQELMTLTAEGGLCAPVNVRYEIFTLGTDRRPLRDALLRFGATRGGIQFNEPPTLADVDGAFQNTTADEDAEGEVYPKNCIRVDCGELVTVEVQALSLCMEVGNFQRLSFPENFRAWWDLGKVEHARQAETFLWTRMVALSLALTAAPDGLGTARRVIAALARGAQQYRDRFRTGDEAIIRAYIPSWLLTMMQVDFLRQAPGDNAVGLAKATIVRYLAAFGIACTFVLDGQAPSAGGYAQADDSALNPWNQTVDIIYTVDGTFLHTDMGELNFGTEIRDFTQIRNNDSGAFFETFENVARVGPQAGRLRLTDVCSSGFTSGPADDLTQLCAEDY